MEVKTERPPSSLERGEDPHFIHTLPVLVVNAHSSCNCRCVMCDIWKTREQKIFGVRELEPQLDSIRRLGVRWIVFSGGEPLMNSELPQLCAIFREEGIRLTLLSTGLLLKKCAKEVAAYFDDVIVSLDGPQEIHDAVRRVPGAFALLQQGIQALRSVRRDIRISARSTVQKSNHRCLRETALAAKSLQLDGISFLAADLTSAAFNRPFSWPANRQAEIGLSESEILALQVEIEALIRCAQYGAGFISESPEKLWRIARHFRAQLGLEPPESPVCNAPWVSAVLETDGSVRPCFFHKSIGNLSGNTLDSIINGDEARTFRANLDIPSNPVCRNCICSLSYRL